MRIFLSFKDGRERELALTKNVSEFPRVVTLDSRIFVWEYNIHGENAAQYTEQDLVALNLLCGDTGGIQ